MASRRYFVPIEETLGPIFAAGYVDVTPLSGNRVLAVLSSGVEVTARIEPVTPSVVRVLEASYRLGDGTLLMTETGLNQTVSLVTGEGGAVVGDYEVRLSDADDTYVVADWIALDAEEIEILGAVAADAGGGYDRIVFDEPRAGVAIEGRPGGAVRLGIDGETVTVRNLEEIAFADCTLRIAPDGTLSGCTGLGLTVVEAQTVALLFEAALDREGAIGLDGLNFWIDRREDGLSERDLAFRFLAAPEFEARFGDALDPAAPGYLDDRALVERLFLNLLDRPGAEAGIDHWTGRLGAEDFTRADLLLAFAGSPENIAGSPAVETLTEIAPGEWAFL